MENEIKELQHDLDHARGEIKALTQLVAAFIAASPCRDAFVREVLPKVARLREHAHQRDQSAQAYRDGLHLPEHALSVWIAMLDDRNDVSGKTWNRRVIRPEP